jgi:putative ATP-binding cassette transporter
MSVLSMLLRVGDRRRIIFALFVSVVAGGAGAATAVWIGSLLAGYSVITTWHWIGTCAAVVTALALDYLSKRTLTEITADVSVDIRMNLSRHVLGMPYERFESLGADALGTLLIEDSRALHSALLDVPVLLVGVVKILGCAAYLAFVSPPTAAALTVVAALIVVVYRGMQQRAYRQSKKWLQFRAGESGVTHTLLDGMREFTMNAERRWFFYSEILRPSVRLAQQTWRSMRLRYQATNAFMQSSQMVVVLSLMAIVSFGLLERERVGEYTVIILYMAASATATLAVMPAFGEAAAVLARIREHGIDPHQRIEDLPKMVPAIVRSDSPFHIELRGVRFHHHHTGEDEFRLGPIDLELRSGEIVFIAGGNGSGKTTLVKLLIGLYAPQGGELRIDGRLVDDEMRVAYRQTFSATFAEAFLLRSLDGYLAGNVSLDQRATELLRRLRLDQKVTVRDGQLSSTDLSTGQRKRLALLGAYLEDRPAYMFDEWAASQDPEFRDLFYRELLPELRSRGKLIVVISHDDAYFDVADRVVRLDFGRISQNQARQDKNEHRK